MSLALAYNNRRIGSTIFFSFCGIKQMTQCFITFCVANINRICIYTPVALGSVLHYILKLKFQRHESVQRLKLRHVPRIFLTLVLLLSILLPLSVLPSVFSVGPAVLPIPVWGAGGLVCWHSGGARIDYFILGVVQEILKENNTPMIKRNATTVWARVADTVIM